MRLTMQEILPGDLQSASQGMFTDSSQYRAKCRGSEPLAWSCPRLRMCRRNLDLDRRSNCTSGRSMRRWWEHLYREPLRLDQWYYLVLACWARLQQESK